MKIEGEDIVFNSEEKWYLLERAGRKPNTIRLVDWSEENEIARCKPKFIRIHCEGEKTISFKRTISWMGRIDTVLGKSMLMFCWES